MTTLAIASALPALFAVALSISTADDYHYVTIPTNMAASLTGVGMGSEASAEDAPLRYEDAAFLAEAYAERAQATKKAEVTSAIRFPNRTTMATRADALKEFIKPALQIAGGVRAAPDKSLGGVLYDFFGTTNIYVEASENEYDALYDEWAAEQATGSLFDKPNTPLKPDYIRALYADLANYTRISTYSYATSSNTNRFIKKYERSPSNYTYDSSTGWYPRSDAEDRTNTTESVGLGMTFYVEYDVGKDNGQCYTKGSDGKWAKDGPEGNFTTYKSSQTYYEASEGDIALKLNLPYLHGASGMLCCRGRVSTSCYVNDSEKESVTKDFLVGFPVTISKDGSNVYAVVKASDVGMSLSSGNAFLQMLCSKFALPFYASKDALLGATNAPGALPAASELDDDESLASKQYTSASHYVNSFYQAEYEISQATLVLDVEFNARLGGGGSGGSGEASESGGGAE